MPKPKSKPIKTLSDFTKIIEQKLDNMKQAENGKFRELWFRGHGTQEYSLIPSLYRHPTIKNHYELLDLESSMIREFRRNGILHSIPSLKKDEPERLETLFYMQHYGVPTRLLDWTSNPFIALYFALTDAERCKSDGEYKGGASVWVLDPWAWNEEALKAQSYGERGPAFPDSIEIRSYAPQLSYSSQTKAQMSADPVAILGTANNARMFAQKGMFTIFGQNTEPMEDTFNTKKYNSSSLFEIVISSEHIETLLTTLIRVGYTDSVAYPDHEGLSLEIKRLNGFRA